MQQIKFRGWNTITKTMLDLKAITPLAIDGQLEQDGLYLPLVKEIILMQFTGLLDKNGKEIYEGDIYTYKQSLARNGRQIYIENKVVVGNTIEDWWKAHCLMSVNNLEVIGNIYEDSELLEE